MSAGEITIKDASINVSALSTGGTRGEVRIVADSDLTVSKHLGVTSTGKGQGTNQEINITGNSVDFSTAVIALDADGDEGGIIKVSSGSGLTIGGTSTIHANGGIFGAPGGVVTLTAGGDLNLSIDNVSANGGLLGGSGGTIELKAGESGSGKMDLGNSKLLANGGVGSTGGIIDIKMNRPDGDLRAGSLISGSDIRFRNTGNLTINLTDTLASDKVTFSSPGNIVVQDLPGSKSGAITGLVNAKNIDSPAAPHVGSFKLTLEKDNSLVRVGHVDSSGPIEVNVSGRVELSEDIVSKSSYVTVFARDRVVVGGKVTTQASGQDVDIYSKQIVFTDLGEINSEQDVNLKGADSSGKNVISELSLIGVGTFPATAMISAERKILVDASSPIVESEDLVLSGNLRLSSPDVKFGENLSFNRVFMLGGSRIVADKRLVVSLNSAGGEGGHLIGGGKGEIAAPSLEITSKTTLGMEIAGIRVQGNESLLIRSLRGSNGLLLTNVGLVSGQSINLQGGQTPSSMTTSVPVGLSVTGGGTVQFMDGGQITVSGGQNALYAAPNRTINVDAAGGQIAFSGNVNVSADTAELNPIGHSETCLVTGSMNQLHHAQNDRISIWTIEDLSLEMVMKESELVTGEFLLFARKELRIVCGKHSIVVGKGAFISLYRDMGILKIRNLLEKNSGDVQLEKATGEPIIVGPGQEIVVAHDRESVKDGVARRAVSWCTDHLLSEYSLLSLTDSSPLLRRFMSRQGYVERELRNGVLKMAACLSLIRRDRGAFSKLR